MFLVLGVFKLFKVSEKTGWKLAVTVMALGVKIGGNKALLVLIGPYNS